jgi:hypothetical protein
MTAPLLQTPPKNPLPDHQRDPNWYGEIWLKYPSSSVLVPLKCSHTFKAKVEFSIILNEAVIQAYGDENNDKVIQCGARRIINVVERLDNWYRSLPDPLLPSNIVFPSQLKLQ